MATEVKISAPKKCNFQPCPDKAEYDFKTSMGPWANGCEFHYKMYRMFRELGTGKGQKLVVES